MAHYKITQSSLDYVIVIAESLRKGILKICSHNRSHGIMEDMSPDSVFFEAYIQQPE